VFRSLCVREQKKSKKEQKNQLFFSFFLNFFVFWVKIDVFSFSFVSFFTKKRNFFLTPEDSRTDLFHLLCAPLNTHAHIKKTMVRFVTTMT